jgi:iron complex outermembrane receptor protein
LPVIGFIESSYANQDSQTVAGVDFSASVAVPLGQVEWVSALSLSYLSKYELTTDAGDELVYDGTLSPCNVTSCSGAPKVRANWANTFEFGEKTTATLTTYYTSGVDTASADFGGIKGDCQFNADNQASTVPYVDGTPTQCKSHAQWNVDLTVLYQWNDRIQLSADFLNAFDIKPEFDPAAAYGVYGFNIAWGGPNIMGRFFRLGVKLDFE